MELTQQDLELRMYSEGRERAALMFSRAEEKERAGDSPYGQRLYRTFVLPLAEGLRQEVFEQGPGAKRRESILLRDLDLNAVAFLTVRHAVNALMSPVDTHHRKLAYALGRTVHRELVLSQFAESHPDLYHTLERDFARRLSKSDSHRMTAFMASAKSHGVDLFQWGIGSRDQVGMFLLGKLEDVGLLDVAPPMTEHRGGRIKSAYRAVNLTQEVLSSIDAVKHYVAETTPVFGPCVEPPQPWTGLTGGGFHTPEMRKIHRYLVKASPSARSLLRDRPMPTVLKAVNALQDTQWAVNSRVLEVLASLAEAGREVAGVVLPVDPVRPERPGFLDEVPTEQMTPQQKAALKSWKQDMRVWYETRKLRGAEYGRFYAATRGAAQFADGRPFHFVYFLDSRGRAYPLTYGLSPQGNDLQRGLLRFHQGLPVHTEAAERWFLIHGANKFGFDKATLSEREQWSRDRRDMILAMADDPTGCLDWTQADNPLQFLAWCFEYADWVRDPGFVSHLPVSMDGSCNGLQHFSAMLRDPIGGKATNLTDNEVMQDIYGIVAKVAYERLMASRDDSPHLQWWRKHGISRSVVKRSVMTTPYGVTRRSATQYVVTDYLFENGTGLERREMAQAASAVMGFVWPAIGDVVVAARSAMDWLKQAPPKILAAKAALGDNDPVISWETPSGFLATQSYFEIELHKVRTRLHGDVRIMVAAETDKADVQRHATALAPNFVHSMDAAHMQLVASRMKGHGVDSLAMIHDDYGTHAAHADLLFRVIREEFVKLYEGFDPLAQFREKYPECSPPPEAGVLDIQEVLRSDFFFS